MIQEGIYRTPDGTEIKLDRNKENIISFTLGGELHATDSKVMYCQGSDKKLKSGIVENTIILEQLKIKILDTNILAESGHRLISDKNMQYLPTKCKSHHLFCYSNQGTFIWNVKKSPQNCDFEFYRSGQFTLVKPYTFMDEHNKMVILFDPNDNGAVLHCNGHTIMETLEGLYVTRRNQNSPWLWNKLKTPSIHQAFEVQYNYLIYTFTNKISLSHSELETNRCRLQNRIRSDTLEHLEGNTFIRDLGDSLALTFCQKTTVTLKAQNSQCYKDVPLENGYFLDRETHVLRFNSSARPCYASFPQAVIRTLGGAYVTFEPNLQTITVSRNYSLFGNLQHNDSIDFLTPNQGLLTSSEWKSLSESIQYSGLREMLSEDLTTSLCLDIRHCTSLITGSLPSTNYDSSVLSLPSPQEVETRLLKELNMSLWDRIIQYIEKQAALVCSLSLLIQIIIFLLTLIDYFLNTNNEGNILRVFINLILRIFCKTNIWRHFTKNKNQRNRNSNQIVRYSPANNVIELQTLNTIQALEDLV